jgi:hypothetical protein
LTPAKLTNFVGFDMLPSTDARQNGPLASVINIVPVSKPQKEKQHTCMLTEIKQKSSYQAGTVDAK